MSESEQDRGPEESAAESSSANIAEKAAGLRAAEPPKPSDVEAAKGLDASRSESGVPETNVPREAGDAADAGTNPPAAAEPGEKDDPDMKDMAVGPRPADEPAGE